MAVAQIKQYLAQLELTEYLNQLPPTTYLVGGSVRDAILQRDKIPWDLDFVVPEGSIAMAQAIANRYHAGFVVLDREREIARVVFSQGTLDFARQVGSTIEQDLYRRDFTINAIAYNLATQQLVDPLGGVADLEQKLLRMVASINLEDDPLRLLRAYRQAAQLNLTIEETTRKAIRDRTAHLSTMAAERVQTELNYLFTAIQGNRWLTTAIEDGLLDYWFSQIQTVNLEELERIDQAIGSGIDLGWDLTELTILSKLATLTSAEATTAEIEITQLKYSRPQIKAVTKTVQYLPQVQEMINNLSLREQYFWFLKVKDIFPILIIKAIATGMTIKQLQPLIERYLNPLDPIAHPQPLLTGNDLLRELNLNPSPVIGKLLTELQIAQIESKIATPQEAIKLATDLLRKQNQIVT